MKTISQFMKIKPKIWDNGDHEFDDEIASIDSQQNTMDNDDDDS